MASRGFRPAPECRPNWRGEINQRTFPPIVRVTWLDACSWPGQISTKKGWQEDYQTGTIQQTVGYQLHRDNKFVVLAMDVNNTTKDARQLCDIPMVNVLDVKVLK